jgi:non-ribosomal peptide synthetase component F
MHYMHSLAFNGLLSENDTDLQITRCAFDVHIQETMGSFVVGASLIMLHPKGNTDFDYVAQILEHKQITYVDAVPVLLHGLFTFLNHNNRSKAGQVLRVVTTGGKLESNRTLHICECFVWL